MANLDRRALQPLSDADVDRVAKFLLDRGYVSAFRPHENCLRNHSFPWISLPSFPKGMGHRYQLSALELHQELQEEGQVNERLRAHFASLASRLTAEPSSPAASGVVVNNYEELLKQKDERVALLEYELRVAREDIASQQSELRRLQTMMSSVYGVIC